jgi:hypothetical protein
VSSAQPHLKRRTPASFDADQNENRNRALSSRERLSVFLFRHYKEQIRMQQRTVWMLALTAALAGQAYAQQFVYPAKGQSPEQQKSDEAACYSWAVQNSGFDPANPPPAQQAATPPKTATGVTPGAGARGAARGAVVGEIAGGDNTGTAAAAGAVAARGQSRRQNAAASQQAQQQQQAGSQQQQQAFSKARAACLEGRGYTVK